MTLLVLIESDQGVIALAVAIRNIRDSATRSCKGKNFRINLGWWFKKSGAFSAPLFCRQLICHVRVCRAKRSWMGHCTLTRMNNCGALVMLVVNGLIVPSPLMVPAVCQLVVARFELVWTR